MAKSNAEVAAELAALTAQTIKTGEETKGALAKLAEAIANQANTSPEVEAALAELTVAVQGNDDLIEDATAPTE